MIQSIGNYLIIKTLFIVKDNMYAFKLVTEASDLEYLKKMSTQYQYENSPSSPYEIQKTLDKHKRSEFQVFNCLIHIGCLQSM